MAGRCMFRYMASAVGFIARWLQLGRFGTQSVECRRLAFCEDTVLQKVPLLGRAHEMHGDTDPLVTQTSQDGVTL